MKKIILGVMVFLCAACAPLAPYGTPGERESPSTIIQNPGYIVGSLGAAKWGPFGSRSFIYHELRFSRKGLVGAPTAIRFIYGSPFSHSVVDFKDSAKHGVAFSVPLEPGEYEFHEISFTSDDGGPIHRKPEGSFSIPFSVVAGQRSYIGEFLACAAFDCKKVDKRYYAGGFFWLDDQFERDMQMINKKFPTEANLPVVKAIPIKDAPPFVIHSRTVLK